MNIYLFQLDSVRNSPEEIRIGQDVLMEQLLTYGNTVVLTMNQLVDSMAFLQAIHDTEKAKVIGELVRLGKIKLSGYNHIVENGFTRKYVSASDYFQNSLSQAIDRISKPPKKENTVAEETSKKDSEKESKSYHFSCRFIDDNDSIQLQVSMAAIRYGNPNIIDDEIETIQKGQQSSLVYDYTKVIIKGEKETLAFYDYSDSSWNSRNENRQRKNTKEAEIQALQEMKNYIALILLISRSDNDSVPPKKEIDTNHKLIGYFHRVRDLYSIPENNLKNGKQASTLTTEEKDLTVRAVRDLSGLFDTYRREEIKNAIKDRENGGTGKGEDEGSSALNSRSIWYNLIHARRLELIQEKKPDAELLSQFMEMIIDLCYNYTCEFSISKLSRSCADEVSLNDFQTEFEKELSSYIAISKNHIFSWQEESVPVAFIDSSEEEQEDWKNMLSIVSMNVKTEEDRQDRKKGRELRAETQKEVTGPGFYDRMKMQKQYWSKTTQSGIHRERFSAAAYLAIFMVFQYISNLVQDLYSSYAERVFNYVPVLPKIVVDLIIMIVMIIGLGFLSSWISQRFHLPDILDSIALVKDSVKKKRLLKKQKQADTLPQ